MHPLAALASSLCPDARGPAALTKIEVRHVWQVAFYASHGFQLKYFPHGNRAFMVRRA